MITPGNLKACRLQCLSMGFMIKWLFNSSSILKYELLLYFILQKLVATVWFIAVWLVQHDILFPNCMIIKVN